MSNLTVHGDFAGRVHRSFSQTVVAARTSAHVTLFDVPLGYIQDIPPSLYKGLTRRASSDQAHPTVHLRLVSHVQLGQTQAKFPGRFRKQRVGILPARTSSDVV